MRILVTGGSNGTGAAIVRQFAGDRSNVVYFTYANNEAAAAALTKDHPNCHSIHCNYKDAVSIDRLVAKIQELELDVLVNNAMVDYTKEHFHKADPQKFAEGFEVNILPVIRITSAAIQDFRKRKSGRIINILSSAIINRPPIGWSDYVAAKNYILSLSKSWATENIKFNITSNSISPSFMATNFTAETDPRIVEQLIQSHPLKRLLSVDEVAQSVLFLATCSVHINGINIIMNAGADII